MDDGHIEPMVKHYLEVHRGSDVEDLIARYPQENTLRIDPMGLNRSDSELFEALIDAPAKVINAIDQVLKNEFAWMEDHPPNLLQIILDPLPDNYRLYPSQLRAENVNKLSMIEGQVRSVSEIQPKIIETAFVCLRCGMEFNRKTPFRGSLEKRMKCANRSCDRDGPFRVNQDACTLANSQIIKLQDPVGAGGNESNSIRTIEIEVIGDLVNRVRPGDRIKVTGIYHTDLKLTNPIQQTFFEGLGIFRDIKGFQEIHLTPDDKAMIQELSRDPAIIQKIVESIAPSIYGLEDAKLAVTLQLASPPPLAHDDGSVTRGDIHVLLIGDPSTGKSQLVRSISKLAPGGRYTSGRGSSAAGLTATVTREKGEGPWTIEAGFLVLADGGFATIDEFTLLHKDELNSLLEAMEQQTVSISKAGNSVTMNAQSPILAAANPKLGRFDLMEPIAEQINLPSTILSRFDLTIMVLDTTDVKYNTELIKHLGKLRDGTLEPAPIESETLRKYFAFVKTWPHLKASKEARKTLEDFYLSLKCKTADNGALAITSRQYEAAERIAEAAARMALKDKIEESDALLAIDLMKRCLSRSGHDFSTGFLDIDNIELGRPKSLMDRTKVVQDAIKELAAADTTAARPWDKSARLEDVLVRCEARGVPEGAARSIIDKMRTGGVICEPRLGYLKLVG